MRLPQDPEQPVCCAKFLSHRGRLVPSFQKRQPKPRASKWEHQNLIPAPSGSKAAGLVPSLAGWQESVWNALGSEQ